MNALPGSALSLASRPALRVLGGLDLVRGRAHEICGPARRRLALLVAAAEAGPVLWIAPAWEGERLHAPALARIIDPGRLIFARPAREGDLLWTLEEALRSGAMPVAVAELPRPPALTPVRRLHLAAGEGGAGGPAPLGLILTPGEGGARGVDSRWHIAPRHGAGRSLWRIERRRARAAPPAAFELREEGRRWRLSRAAPADVTDSAGEAGQGG